MNESSEGGKKAAKKKKIDGCNGCRHAFVLHKWLVQYPVCPVGCAVRFFV